MIRGARGFRKDQRGSAAVEFALLIPAMVLIIFALVHVGLLAWSEVSLHWTVEQASRCAVVTEQYTTLPGDPAVSCDTEANTTAYAKSIFNAPVAAPSFTPTIVQLSASTNQYCKQVAGKGTYYIRIWMISWDVPITAQACYPSTATSWS